MRRIVSRARLRQTPHWNIYQEGRYRRKQRHKKPAHTWLNLVWLGLAGMLFFTALGASCMVGSAIAAYNYLASMVPTDQDLRGLKVTQSTKIFDRYGNLLFEVFDPAGGRRTNVTPDQIPEVLKQATIATEDPTFYTNPGVDPEGIARALIYLYRNGEATVGGSTITQQLVKTTLLTPEPTIWRKIREAVYALDVTRRYSKPDILAMYLNTINFGNLSYGVQAASKSYFQKDVSQLDLAEASLLAGLPQAPSVYDPCRDPAAALGRQQVVLRLMLKENYIAQGDADAAAKEMSARLNSDAFQANCNTGIAQVYPHFVEYVREQLETIYGPEMVYRGGLQVYTSLDPAMQAIAEQEAQKQIAQIKAQNVHSAAVVVANPQTGEIYAMVGSVNFYDKSIDGQVNVANRLRQPGSSIKPVNYVAALEKGWTLATPILDVKTSFPDGVNKPYVPVNYDGKEHGTVTVRTALANSYNIPAVKTLQFVTVPRMIASAQRFGITTFGDPNRYGLSLTLGGGEVKLVELTGAYAVFANGGNRVPLTPFNKIVDPDGQVIFDAQQNMQTGHEVVDPRNAYLITSVLSDNKARTPAFGQNSPLKLCLDGTTTCKEDAVRPAAAKTGTTNDFRDNWTLGYTPELVVGVWVGNPRNQEMQHVSGITGAAPIWHNVMSRIYHEIEPFKSVAPHPFAIPPGLVQATVCRPSGLLASAGCPNKYQEIFLAERAPTRYDDDWIPVLVDKTNGLLANDNCPPDQVETRYFRAPGNGGASGDGNPLPPTTYSPCAQAAKQ